MLQVFGGDHGYLSAAERCAQSIWWRGLLQKGYGLCHGIAGNGYALLAMYKLTGDQLYLNQAREVSSVFCYNVRAICYHV